MDPFPAASAQALLSLRGCPSHTWTLPAAGLARPGTKLASCPFTASGPVAPAHQPWAHSRPDAAWGPRVPDHGTAQCVTLWIHVDGPVVDAPLWCMQGSGWALVPSSLAQRVPLSSQRLLIPYPGVCTQCVRVCGREAAPPCYDPGPAGPPASSEKGRFRSLLCWIRLVWAPQKTLQTPNEPQEAWEGQTDTGDLRWM
ncbi:hypothetical protein P7K49_005839 [Saguinus oedipus]|uniref:Uncharacterized protein n=1 Tax=Saguinus oedipus TaxID=9490 RepID=A0ABQ9W0P7_SAGOE|nr:hypothetical protein P7K49_005839 [Saguinus oedipus]